MEGHALVETALQIAYCGQFAHRLTQPGYCKFTKQPVLYAVKPDRVINAAENLVRSVKKNLVNSVKNLVVNRKSSLHPESFRLTMRQKTSPVCTCRQI